MKNVTISLDDETHRAARIRAAEMGTSLSALVKDFLGKLGEAPNAQGVCEMPMAFAAQPGAPNPASVPNPKNAPYFVNGKWVFTPDGKPRKPGGLKGKMWIADDFNEWPDDILTSFEAWSYDDPDFDPLPFDEKQLPPE
jgi:plasmid stability protein